MNFKSNDVRIADILLLTILKVTMYQSIKETMPGL